MKSREKLGSTCLRPQAHMSLEIPKLKEQVKIFCTFFILGMNNLGSKAFWGMASL